MLAHIYNIHAQYTGTIQFIMMKMAHEYTDHIIFIILITQLEKSSGTYSIRVLFFYSAFFFVSFTLSHAIRYISLSSNEDFNSISHVIMLVYNLLHRTHTQIQDKYFNVSVIIHSPYPGVIFTYLRHMQCVCVCVIQTMFLDNIDRRCG